MIALAVILGVLWFLTAAYLVIVLRQIRAVRRQLERQRGEGAHSSVTLSLVVPQLESLAAQVNETVRQAQAASTRTRVEERRIRSFIADISHDLRTPLTTVRGYLQLLERSTLDEEQRAQLAVAQRQTAELGTLVDRLYEYAYLLDAEPALELEPVDVGVLVAECLLGMTAEIEGAGMEVDYDPPAALVVETDREKLTRIVQNLVRNAVQHGRELLQVQVQVLGAGDGLEIRVRNGVPPGTEIDAARLFERFYTADRSRSGRTSGLGLSIVQVLAEHLGGSVAAAQDREAGTVEIGVSIPRPTSG
ncbi:MULTISPECIES: sensor histidine kinase [unclassified Brachybacterium]|uniref:sensor histidine kinase n=1 Tax=unclassified Brachybacterium TaxID=2623841 RepID=UPI0036138329